MNGPQVVSPQPVQEITRSEVEALAGEVVFLQAELDRICAERDGRAAAAVELIRKEYEQSVNETGQLAKQKAADVEAWVAKHREEVLPGEIRSFKTTGAAIGYRWGKSKLVPAKGLTWEEIKLRIKGLKKKFVELVDGTKVPFAARFIRTIEEVDVQQLTADATNNLVGHEDRAKIGVVLDRQEFFYINGR